jgi:hypothetical protein
MGVGGFRVVGDGDWRNCTVMSKLVINYQWCPTTYNDTASNECSLVQGRWGRRGKAGMGFAMR